MTQRTAALVAYRLIFGLLGFSAIVTEIATVVERGRFTPANFFAYFTIQSNILAAVVLLVGAVAAAGGWSRRLDAVRAAVTVYILIVGIGFTLLLSRMEDTEFTAVPWDNVVLHYVIPVAVLVDLLVDRPARRLPLPVRLAWLAYPLAYAVFSLARGAIGGWYPYPFLDPDTDGTAAVAITVAGLMVLALALTWVVDRICRDGRPAA